MNRRHFLQLTGLSGLALGTGARAAQPYNGPYFVVVHAEGGWDTTALMDPKGTPRVNRTYTAADIVSAGNILHAPTAAALPGGMTNEAFFSKYANELLVVNGIDIAVNNHSPCTRYVGSGKLNSAQYPSFPALAAACIAPDAPLAFMALGGASATGNLIAKNNIAYMPSLLELARADYVDQSHDWTWNAPAATSRIDEALAEVSQGSLPGTQRARRFIHDAQVASQDLSWIEPHAPAVVPSDPVKLQMEVALTTFVSGTAVAATVGFGQFDSHNNNDVEQTPLIAQLLDAVDHLMEGATRLGIRDQLVVIMSSEMGRTPWYNQYDGKDHWSVGSMMFMGAGISGNRVVGGTQIDPATGEDQSPMLINPTTLALDSNGIRIRPEHIHEALRELAGIAQHPHAGRFDLGVPANERLLHLFG